MHLFTTFFFREGKGKGGLERECAQGVEAAAHRHKGIEAEGSPEKVEEY